MMMMMAKVLVMIFEMMFDMMEVTLVNITLSSFQPLITEHLVYGPYGVDDDDDDM
jgi:hypothetical protein